MRVEASANAGSGPPFFSGFHAFPHGLPDIPAADAKAPRACPGGRGAEISADPNPLKIRHAARVDGGDSGVPVRPVDRVLPSNYESRAVRRPVGSAAGHVRASSQHADPRIHARFANRRCPSRRARAAGGACGLGGVMMPPDGEPGRISPSRKGTHPAGPAKAPSRAFAAGPSKGGGRGGPPRPACVFSGGRPRDRMRVRPGGARGGPIGVDRRRHFRRERSETAWLALRNAGFWTRPVRAAPEAAAIPPG